MFKSKETSPPVDKVVVRSLSEADPNYAAAAETLARLRSKSRDLDREESTILQRLHDKPAEPPVSTRVAALLGDIELADEAAPDGASARLRAIASERIDLRQAIDIATQRVTVARFAASKAICDELRPEYQKRVQALAVALQAAQAAHVQVLEITSDLNSADVAWTAHLPPLQANNILGHDNDRVAAWLKDAAPMLEDRT